MLGETSLDDNQRSRKKWRQMLVKSKNTAVDMLKTQTDSLLKSKWKKKLLTTGCILVSSFISYLSYKCPCNIKCSHTEVVTVCWSLDCGDFSNVCGPCEDLISKWYHVLYSSVDKVKKSASGNIRTKTPYVKSVIRTLKLNAVDRYLKYKLSLEIFSLLEFDLFKESN